MRQSILLGALLAGCVGMATLAEARERSGFRSGHARMAHHSQQFAQPSSLRQFGPRHGGRCFGCRARIRPRVGVPAVRGTAAGAVRRAPAEPAARDPHPGRPPHPAVRRARARAPRVRLQAQPSLSDLRAGRARPGLSARPGFCTGPWRFRHTPRAGRPDGLRPRPGGRAALAVAGAGDTLGRRARRREVGGDARAGQRRRRSESG